MGYTAGTLDLSIFGVSDDAVKSISNVEKSLNSLSRSIQIFAKTDINKTFSKLAESVNIFSQSAKNLDVSGFEKLSVIGTTGKGINSLANAINKLNASSTVFATQQISNLFEKLSISSQKIDTTALSNLSSIGKSLSSISNISRLDKIDWDKAGQGFNKLATAITPFLNKVKEAEASLNALYGILNKSSSKKIGGLLEYNSSKKSSKGLLGGLLYVGKLTAVLYAGRKLGSVFANIAQKGADFSETLNLWQVSMGQDFLPQATEFVNKLNEAYGISKKTLMNSQAIFKNMLGSLGQISEQSAYALSEGITQMALDYASLYNVKFEDAMTKFQAALAGQVRPIRSVSGYDITENTLFQLYQQLGGTKTMRQLSRTEKQLLAIYAVFQQMERSGATGDLGRTLGSFANQSRIASENFKEILTYSGLIFTRWVQTTDLFQKFNGFLIFIGDVLEAVANTLPDIEVPNDPMADMAQNAEQTNKEIDEMQGKLLGFDKFRSLNPTESSDEGMGLDQNLIDAFSKYGTIFDEIDDTSKQFAEYLKIASGLFDENGVFQPEKWDSLAKSIGGVASAIGVGLVGAFLIASAKFLLLTGGIALLVLGIQSLISEDIYNGLLLIAGAIFLIGAAISIATGSWIPLAISAIISAVVVAGAFIYKYWDDIKTFFINLWDTVSNAFIVAWEAVSTWFMKLINTISNAFITFVNWCIDALNFLLSPVSAISELLGGESIEIKHWEAKVDWGGVGTFAEGGLPDKGSMFVAGEAGAEMVYNMPSGQSGVANIQQIAQATYNGTIKALNDWWGGSGAKSDIPQLKEANATGMYQAVTGVAHQYGKDWNRF